MGHKRRGNTYRKGTHIGSEYTWSGDIHGLGIYKEWEQMEKRHIWSRDIWRKDIYRVRKNTKRRHIQIHGVGVYTER